MARKKRARRRAAPTAIVVRQAAPVARRRRRSAGGHHRAIVGRVVRKARGNPMAGRAVNSLVQTGVSAAAGALVGWGVSKGHLPQRVAGIEANVVAAVALSLVPVVVPGKVGRLVGEVGSAVGAIGAYKIALGTSFYVKDASGWAGDEGY